ncbi:MAG: PEP-CTERM sorting domain-containing protein [Chthoniobacterales bacterium]
MKKLLIAAVMSVALTAGAFAASNASDNASTTNYPGGAWTTGSNGGSGFGAWTLTSTPAGGFSGSYIGGTALGNPTFGIYSGGNAAATMLAYRPFTGGGLTSGQAFSVSLANTATINGEIGLNLMSGATARWTLKFVGGGQNWLLNDGGGSDFSSGQAYIANNPLTLTFTYNGGNSYSYVFGTGSGNNFTAANLANIDGVQFFSVNQGGDQNMGINSLSVVPEPSTYALLALSAAAFGGYVARRRRRS